MFGMTRRHYDLLTFIGERLRETGVPPSYDEMKIAMGLHSKSGIHRMICALEERGHIQRLPNRARAIKLVTEPRYRAALDFKNWKALTALAESRGASLDTVCNDILSQQLGGPA